MPAPKISILLPLYKVEKYVTACLQSILAQTSYDFEIIAVDDCSPDLSGKIVADILGAQSTIPWKLITNSANVGLAETRRIAANHASGDYVLCVDSDDHIDRDLLRIVAREAAQYDADVVIFAATNVYADGSVNYLIESDDTVITGIQAVEKILGLSLQAYCWNKLVRRSIFIQVEHPSGLIYEDICVSVQTLAQARTVRLIPDRLYFYVLRDSGISTSFNPKVTDLFAILDLVEKTTRLLPIEDYRRLFFRLKYIYGFRTIAFQAAMRAPDYKSAKPILLSVARKLHLAHLRAMYADDRPRLTFVMCLLKIHPRIFYGFTRRFSNR